MDNKIKKKGSQLCFNTLRFWGIFYVLDVCKGMHTQKNMYLELTLKTIKWIILKNSVVFICSLYNDDNVAIICLGLITVWQSVWLGNLLNVFKTYFTCWIIPFNEIYVIDLLIK